MQILCESFIMNARNYVSDDFLITSVSLPFLNSDMILYRMFSVHHFTTHNALDLCRRIILLSALAQKTAKKAKLHK